MLLLVGVSVNVPVPDGWLALMVMSKLFTGVNPTTPVVPDPATDAVTVLAVPKRVDPRIVAVTVTWVAPSFSVTSVGLTDSSMLLGAPSSSVTVKVVSVTVTSARVPLKVMTASISSVVSASGATVTVACPEAVPAAMVMLKPAMAPTPTAPEVLAAVTATVLVVPNRVAPPTVAVTVTLRLVPDADSVIDDGDTDNAMFVGVASSSVTVSVVSVTVTPERVPLKVMTALVSSTTSAWGAMVTVACPEAVPAAMVMLKGAMAPTPTAPEVLAAVTATVLVVPNRVAPPTVAVTVTLRLVPDADSVIDDGDTDNAMFVGVASSSVIVTVVEEEVPRS